MRQHQIDTSHEIAELAADLTRGEVGTARRAFARFDHAFTQNKALPKSGHPSEGGGEMEFGVFPHYFVLTGALEHATQRLKGLKHAKPDKDEVRTVLGWHLAQLVAWLHLARRYDPILAATSNNATESFAHSDRSIAECQKYLVHERFISNDDIYAARLCAWEVDRAKKHGRLTQVRPCPICRAVTSVPSVAVQLG